MSRRYQIKTVADFMKVPKEKRAECLADFEDWLSIMDNHKELEGLLDYLSKTEGAFSTQHNSFTWIDDGKRGVSGVEFSAKGEGDQ
ncbi:MAG: hypothetical protein R3193_08815 [Marinobacter sp.]|nr:hypothetical protein [Marinobacter sp.]